MKATLELLDVCYPDYFSGYHRPVIAVPVYNNMTHSDLASGIESELNSVYDYLTNPNNGFTKTEILIIEEYIEDLKTNPVYLASEWFIGEEFEEDEEDLEFPYAYLSIARIRYAHGMRFLN